MHAYEGYPLAQITFPVRVMKRLGADLLIVTNACGGLNPQFRTGDLMVIDDHINLMNDNPLIGINDDRLGPRFPDMSAPYTPHLIDAALTVARHENFAAHRGVYVAVTGPNLETRAEYRFLRTIGADVVGMSTVPEVIVAVHAGMKVLGISVITDMCLPGPRGGHRRSHPRRRPLRRTQAPRDHHLHRPRYRQRIISPSRVGEGVGASLRSMWTESSRSRDETCTAPEPVHLRTEHALSRSGLPPDKHVIRRPQERHVWQLRHLLLELHRLELAAQVRQVVGGREHVVGREPHRPQRAAEPAVPP